MKEFMLRNSPRLRELDDAQAPVVSLMNGAAITEWTLVTSILKGHSRTCHQPATTPGVLERLSRRPDAP